MVPDILAQGSLLDNLHSWPTGGSVNGPDPAWSSALANIAMMLYETTGDERIVEEMYPGIRQWVEFYLTWRLFQMLCDMLSGMKYVENGVWYCI